MPAADPQLSLQPIVFRPGRIAIRDCVATGTVSVAKTRRCRVLAGGQSRWDQVLETSINQRLQKRICIRLLEVAYGVVSYVTDLGHNFVGDLALDTKVPLLRIWIVKILGQYQLTGKTRV